MTWFQEMKPFFVIVRAYGMAPYSLVNGEICLSRGWRIYTFIWLVARFCISMIHPYLLSVFHTGPKTLPLPLSLMRSLSIEMSFIVEGFVCALSFNKLRTAIDLIDDYDRAVRVNFAKRSLAVWAWLILTVPPIIIGLNIFALNSRETMFLKTLDIYPLIRITGWFAMIFKFAATINSIHRRFQHLRTVITAESPTIIYGPGGNWRRPVRLSDIGRLHGNLISAAMIINSMHNTALLIWLGEIIIYFTMKVHQFVFIGSNISMYSNSTLSATMVVADMTILWYICFCCHRASEAANTIGYMALSTRSCVLRGRFRYERDENYFVGQHFIKNPLRFSAGYGFFTLDLHLMQTILATVTTLVVNLAA